MEVHASVPLPCLLFAHLLHSPCRSQVGLLCFGVRVSPTPTSWCPPTHPRQRLVRDSKFQFSEAIADWPTLVRYSSLIPD